MTPLTSEWRMSGEGRSTTRVTTYSAYSKRPQVKSAQITPHTSFTNHIRWHNVQRMPSLRQKGVQSIKAMASWYSVISPLPMRLALVVRITGPDVPLVPPCSEPRALEHGQGQENIKSRLVRPNLGQNIKAKLWVSSVNRS